MAEKCRCGSELKFCITPHMSIYKLLNDTVGVIFSNDILRSYVFLAAVILNLNTSPDFDFHVTVHRDKFLIIKPTRCANFSNLFFGRKLYMFRAVPLSIIRSFSLYT
jgi:hypothetical protein